MTKALTNLPNRCFIPKSVATAAVITVPSAKAARQFLRRLSWD
jgi:hypothetical protein